MHADRGERHPGEQPSRQGWAGRGIAACHCTSAYLLMLSNPLARDEDEVRPHFGILAPLPPRAGASDDDVVHLLPVRTHVPRRIPAVVANTARLAFLDLTVESLRLFHMSGRDACADRGRRVPKHLIDLCVRLEGRSEERLDVWIAAALLVRLLHAEQRHRVGWHRVGWRRARRHREGESSGALLVS